MEFKESKKLKKVEEILNINTKIAPQNETIIIPRKPEEKEASSSLEFFQKKMKAIKKSPKAKNFKKLSLIFLKTWKKEAQDSKRETTSSPERDSEILEDNIKKTRKESGRLAVEDNKSIICCKEGQMIKKQE